MVYFQQSLFGKMSWERFHQMTGWILEPSYCYEQGVTDGNLSGFAAQQIFHHKAHTVHLLKNQYHENMEVKVDEIQSEK